MGQTGRERTHYFGDGCQPPHGEEFRQGREGDSQPMPAENDRPPIHNSAMADLDHYGLAEAKMVKIDLLARQQVGIRRYGTPLQAFNGRDPLRDWYDEILDGIVYARQALEEMGCGPLTGSFHSDSPEVERFISFTREQRRRWNILAEGYQTMLKLACTVRIMIFEDES